MQADRRAPLDQRGEGRVGGDLSRGRRLLGVVVEGRHRERLFLRLEAAHPLEAQEREHRRGGRVGLGFLPPEQLRVEGGEGLAGLRRAGRPRAGRAEGLQPLGHARLGPGEDRPQRRERAGLGRRGELRREAGRGDQQQVAPIALAAAGHRDVPAAHPRERDRHRTGERDRLAHPDERLGRAALRSGAVADARSSRFSSSSAAA